MRPVLKLAQARHRHVVLCGLRQADELQLEALMANSQCMSVTASGEKSLGQRYSDAASACFELIQRILQEKSCSPSLVQVVVADTPEDSVLVGLSGLLRTAALENPRLRGQVVLVRPEVEAHELAAWLQAEGAGAHECVVRYGHGTRQVLRLREFEMSAGASLPAFKYQGVYLITGGLGGLGLLFAQEILRQAGEANIVLTGRSELSEEHRRQLDSLCAEGGSIEYRRLDVADVDAVDRLVRGVIYEHRQLNGIIHAAGVRSDSFIQKKTAAEFARVLSPKVSGTLNLDRATRDLDLDFIALFSSGASVMGNTGQADYAAANGFMDQFARHRNEMVQRGERRGRTLAVNWPLWQDGGMGIDAEIQERFERVYGIRPLLTPDGLRAFHDVLSARPDEIVVMAGDVPKLRDAVLAACASPAALPEYQIEEQLAALFSLPTR